MFYTQIRKEFYVARSIKIFDVVAIKFLQLLTVSEYEIIY